jgi:hypothetical protein
MLRISQGAQKARMVEEMIAIMTAAMVAGMTGEMIEEMTGESQATVDHNQEMRRGTPPQTGKTSPPERTGQKVPPTIQTRGTGKGGTIPANPILKTQTIQENRHPNIRARALQKPRRKPGG